MPSIERDFGGEERSFLLRAGELRKVQEKCDAGPGTILRELSRCVQVQLVLTEATPLQLFATGLGDWRIDWIREPILQGLIGGGLTPNEAGRLVHAWIDERGMPGLLENAALAWELVAAGISIPKGEVQAGAASGETPAAADGNASTSARSTRAPAPSGSASGPSTKPSSGSSSARSPASTPPTARKSRRRRPATTSTTG